LQAALANAREEKDRLRVEFEKAEALSQVLGDEGRRLKAEIEVLKGGSAPWCSDRRKFPMFDFGEFR